MKILLKKYTYTVITQKLIAKMSSFITLDQVLVSHAKHPNAVLSWHPSNFRDLKKINKKAKFDVTWVNIQFITDSGKKVPCKLKIKNQILASGAKAPQTKEKDDISSFTVQFKSLSREDIEGGDYVPRTLSTREDQEKEVKRVAKNIDGYTANNAKLIQVLDILNASFIKVASEIIEADKNREVKFTVRKDRKKKDVTIFPLKQSTRYDEEKREDIPLESPIFRIKVPVYKKDGRIGAWNNYKDCFRPIVFDARKMTTKNGFTPVPAYVKKGKKKIPLNRSNVSGYITYKSLVSGIIQFDSATISKAGISCGNKFYNMYIVRHKSASKPETVTAEDISDMREGLASDEEGSDVELEEKEKNNQDEEDPDDFTDKEEEEELPDEDDKTSDGEALDALEEDGEENDKVDTAIEKPRRKRKGASLKKTKGKGN